MHIENGIKMITAEILRFTIRRWSDCFDGGYPGKEQYSVQNIHLKQLMRSKQQYMTKNAAKL